ncbi:hypothetical protein DFH06DRAFT_1333918 [Mycena polygramma]|nr:hypothetical protein DFH06DRAFT_1333918 [Mycena polygramma]
MQFAASFLLRVTTALSISISVLTYQATQLVRILPSIWFVITIKLPVDAGHSLSLEMSETASVDPGLVQGAPTVSVESRGIFFGGYPGDDEEADTPEAASMDPGLVQGVAPTASYVIPSLDAS